ncbi:MAG: hypothetical protein GY940_41740 [bacterium]|nr:hypothetical protein [bacterium]
MKCPNCNKEAISLGKYLFKFTANPFKMKCKNCDTVLKPGRILAVFYGIFILSSMVVGFKIGWSLSRWSKDDEIYLVILAGVLIVGFLADFFVWKYGQYEIKEE